MVLNILNGDSTLYNFHKSGMEGDTIVWREMLSEGPVDAGRSYADFFCLRSRWFDETISNDADYERKVISEFNRLASHPKTDEIVLWFEFDLHCQVNLIFLLNYFSQCGNEFKLSLICPDSHPNHEKFKGIGELSPGEFNELPMQMVTLDQQDLRVASQAWEAYCSADMLKIEKFISLDHHHLVCLAPAFEAHLNRFPNKETGLSKMERVLADIINSGFTKKADIYNEFWRSNSIYGMGDAQIDIYIKKLEKQLLIPPIEG